MTSYAISPAMYEDLKDRVEFANVEFAEFCGELCVELDVVDLEEFYRVSEERGWR